MRFAIEAFYSADPDRGSVRVFVDLNGDGNALDQFEAARRQSPPTRSRPRSPIPTAKQTTRDGIAAGEAIPSHLRVGVYRDPVIPCSPACRIRVDNVQVIAPN